MTLDEAIQAHIDSTLYASTFGDPKELVQVGPIRVIRDAPGRRRDPRKETFLISGVDPDKALEEVRFYGPKHWALSVIDPAGAEYDRTKAGYKSRGYRLIIRFPFFALDLSKPVPIAASFPVDRVTTKDRALAIKHVSGHWQVPEDQLVQGDARIRLYACFFGPNPVGWVQSIRANEQTAWVSGLYVTEDNRQKGIGSTLMSYMLREDAMYGAKYSALLASNDGSEVYRRMGYKELGLMQIFSPIKPR